jgi:GNAT superfamily N-acetyltransferase
LPGIKNKVYHLAVLDGQATGFGHAGPGEIVALFIAPEAMGRGYGSRMLKYLLTIADPENTGKVKVESTINAESFYKKHGFKKIRNTCRVCRDRTEIPTVEMELKI